jgi:hypothetical protein
MMMLRSGSSVSEVAAFRKEAEECRQLASTSKKPEDKVFWLRLAEDWLKLAQQVENRRKKQ